MTAGRVRCIRPHFRSLSCRDTLNKITDPCRLSSLITLREDCLQVRSHSAIVSSCELPPSNIILAVPKRTDSIGEHITVSPVLSHNNYVALLRIKSTVAKQPTLVRKFTKISNDSKVSIAKLLEERGPESSPWPPDPNSFRNVQQVESKPKFTSKKSTAMTLGEGQNRLSSIGNKIGTRVVSSIGRPGEDRQAPTSTSRSPGHKEPTQPAKPIWQEEIMESGSIFGTNEINPDRKNSGSSKDRRSSLINNGLHRIAIMNSNNPSLIARHSPGPLFSDITPIEIAEAFDANLIDHDEAFNLEFISCKRVEGQSAEDEKVAKLKTEVQFNFQKLFTEGEGPTSRISFVPQTKHKQSASLVSDLPGVPDYRGQAEVSGESKGIHFHPQTQPSQKRLLVNFDHIKKIAQLLKNSNTSEVKDPRERHSERELG